MKLTQMLANVIMALSTFFGTAQADSATSKQTPQSLIDAAARGSAENIDQLLKQGSDVNERDKDGNTPLIIAASRGQTDIVKLLLQKGADIKATNPAGKNAEDVASQAGYKDLAVGLIRSRYGYSFDPEAVSITPKPDGTVTTEKLGREESERLLRQNQGRIGITIIDGEGNQSTIIPGSRKDKTQ
jgi:hypothetical protein